MEALEKQKIIYNLTSGIVHDINNVLTTIIGYTDILLSNNSCTNSMEEIEIIKKIALDGAEIVKRVKDFTKTNEESKKVFDISETIQTAVMITKPIWYNQAIIQERSINIKYKKEQSAFIYGNESEFREALINIILNSIDAIERNGIIEIEVYKDGDKAIIVIKDNGIGMTEETKNKIFTPFFTTKSEKGSGLGLSNTLNTINEMGGKIEVISNINSGTEFKIEIPIVEVKIEEKTENKKNPQQYNFNILIIDDQIEICSVVKEMLAKIVNREIETCTRGREAINLIEKNSYDIVITDIAIPDISGFELIKYTKKIKPETSIIAMTGWNGFIDKNMNIIPDFILSKPFTLEELEASINKIYELKHNLVV